MLHRLAAWHLSILLKKLGNRLNLQLNHQSYEASAVAAIQHCFSLVCGPEL